MPNRNRTDYSRSDNDTYRNTGDYGSRDMSFRDDTYGESNDTSRPQGYSDDHRYTNRTIPDDDNEGYEARRYWQNRNRFSSGRTWDRDRTGMSRDDMYRRDIRNDASNTRASTDIYRDDLHRADRAGDTYERERWHRGQDYALNDYKPANNRGQRGASMRDFSAGFEPHMQDDHGYFTGSHSQVWERPTAFRDTSNTMDHPFDPEYWNWRNAELSRHDNAYNHWRAEQARNYDNAYNDWRKARVDKFSKDFTDWRSAQADKSAAKAEAKDATKEAKDSNKK